MSVLPRAGDQFLAGAGLTTILPEFDFETYSEAGYVWNEALQKWEGLPLAGKTKRGLPVVGVYNYVLHPSFRIIQLAYDLKDGHGASIWRPGMPLPTPLFTWLKSYRPEQPADWTLGLIEAWNCFFEMTVWALHCVPKLGWPPMYLDQIRDVMAKAALAGIPRKLENAGIVLKLVNQKDKAGAKLIKDLTVPRNPTKKNPAKFLTRETAPAMFAKFDAYNVTDILAQSEANSKLQDLPPRELLIWKVDQRINHRGMQLDEASIYNAIAINEQAATRYNAELNKITNGAVKSFSEVAATLKWMYAKYGVRLEKLDEDTVTNELTRNHDAAVRRVLQIRQTLSFGSVRKLYAMILSVCPDGRLRDQFSYASAHTHLWNGQGPQVMNLYKSEKFNKPEQIEFALAVLASRDLDFVEEVFKNGPPWDPNDNDPMDALDVIANCLRSMIIARPGARLMSADYSQIQAVVTAALAGEKWQLDVFHNNEPLYLVTASLLTGNSVEFYTNYKKREGKHHSDRQLYGKIPTLANGFGAWIGGWRRFDKDGILGSDEEVKALILKMWAKSPNTCELWGGQTRNKFNRARDGSYAPAYKEYYGLEGAAVKAVLEPGTTYGYRGVRYVVHNDVLYCQPPGDCSPLCYAEPRLKPSTRPYATAWELSLTYVGWNSSATKGKGGWVEMDLYGGVLTQNVVAKIAREYQADTLVALEQTEIYLPVHHAHDENVVEVENGRGAIDEYLSIVNRTARPWAVDDWGRPWPIQAPGAEETQRYGRWE